MKDFQLMLSFGGETGANFQFGRFGAWELSIGDGDYETLTLRDSRGNRIAEEEQQRVKPFLKNNIVKNEKVTITINEKQQEGKLLVVCSINEQSFKFLLDLPEKWEEKDDIYFGLIDYSQGENKTSVYWSSPDIVGHINN